MNYTSGWETLACWSADHVVAYTLWEYILLTVSLVVLGAFFGWAFKKYSKEKGSVQNNYAKSKP